MVSVINLKENNSSADYATHLIDVEIANSRMIETNVIIAIHGYGSHGVGGVIKQEIHGHLNALKKFKKIIDFVPGEMWGTSSKVVTEMCKRYPELIINSQLSNANSGVTIIWVYR